MTYRVALVAIAVALLTPLAHAGGPDAQWLATVQGNIALEEYHFEPGENGGYGAPNRAQGFRVAVVDGKVQVSPRVVTVEGTSKYTFAWRTARWGRPGALEQLDHLVAFEKDGGMRLELGPVVETLTNEAHGLEQGFEIAVRARGRLGERLVIEAELTTDLLAHPSADGRLIEWVDATGKAVLWLSALAVQDAKGTAVPAWFEVGPHRLAIVIDDDDAVYPLVVDPLLTSPLWTGQTNQTNAHYGASVSTAGDVNGDGYSDILVAAPDYDNGQANEGRVFLYFGSPSGPPTSFSRAFESNQADAHFGSSVSAAGDLNGDGFDDFAIGAIGLDDPQADEGAVFVYTGAATPAAIVRATTLEVDQASAEFGYALAYGGDVDGDGYPELVVGAPNWDGGSNNEGAMFVYFGDPTTVIRAGTPFRAESDQAGANLGYSVAGGTDVGADGFSDVFAGALNWDTATVVGAGRVLGFFGSSTGLPATPSWTQDGEQGDFGESVAAVGDTNGDGFADLAVGASFFDGTFSDEGRVYLYPGINGGLSHAAQTLDGGAAQIHLGIAVAPAGDVNGDGFADVAVGTSPPVGNNGEVRVWLGSPTGLPTVPSWTYTGDQVDAETGRAVFTAGDVNGDGYSDLIMGAPGYDTGAPDGGQAYVFLGSGGGLHSTAQATLSQPDAVGDLGGLGWAVASAGDVNADGFSDVIVGAPFFGSDGSDGGDGAAWIYLGSATGLNPTPHFEIRSYLLSHAELGYAVSGVGDVNGDGYDDVAVGVPRFFYVPGNGGEYSGQIIVFYGSATGVDENDDDYYPSFPPTFLGDDRFGEVICPIGDVNGDGRGDFYGSSGEGFGGFAVTFFGSSGPDLRVEDGPGRNTASCAGGDFNHDGFSDLLLGGEIYNGGAAGLPNSPSWNAPTGGVVEPGDFNGDGHLDVVTASDTTLNLFLGSASGPDETADQTLPISGGVSDLASGDVNGDRFTDLIVGSADANAPGALRAGRAMVFLGSASGLATAPAFTREGTASGARLGRSVAGNLDVNGDGFSDVVIGEPFRQDGFAYVHLGGGGDGLEYIPRNVRGNDTAFVGLGGWSASPDRFRIYSRGRSARGRALVAMDHLVAPLGTRLDSGTLVHGGYFDTGTTDSAGADVNFNRLVSGLTLATPYTWAMQFRAKDPIFPHTRWISLPGNGREEIDVRTACTFVNWYRDADGDTYGTGSPVVACLQPPGYGAGSGDCNDANPAISPGNPEICDGLDNDCAGGVDNGFLAPVDAPSLAASKSGVTIGLSWPGLAGADRYDVVRGDLGTLRSSGGASPAPRRSAWPTTAL